ncbi:MAG TPA: hypothetical protein DCW29_16475 [Janthinobacterium sp.]|nr:hypothetical protein [Janthinobacterium sp.]
MPHRQPSSQHESVRRGATLRLRRRARDPWRLCVALFTALSFILLLATAATHHHKAFEAQDCALCSAVLDKVADVATPPVLVRQAEILLYFIQVATAQAVAYASPHLLPPSCGPPHATV